MKLFSCLILLFFLSGCAAFDILNSLTPPELYPVCDSESVGTPWRNKICLKYSDGTYEWTIIQENKKHE
jgi:hypothetical protein